MSKKRILHIIVQKNELEHLFGQNCRKLQLLPIPAPQNEWHL